MVQLAAIVGNRVNAKNCVMKIRSRLASLFEPFPELPVELLVAIDILLFGELPVGIARKDGRHIDVLPSHAERHPPCPIGERHPQGRLHKTMALWVERLG